MDRGFLVHIMWCLVFFGFVYKVDSFHVDNYDNLVPSTNLLELDLKIVSSVRLTINEISS